MASLAKGRETAEKEIGAIINALIDDSEFQLITERDVVWADLSLTPAARKYIRKFVRMW